MLHRKNSPSRPKPPPPKQLFAIFLIAVGYYLYFPSRKYIIDKFWKKFVVEGQGVKCVSDEPWVTVAETAEFILTLASMGRQDLAGIIFNWITEKRFEDGSFWCGFTVPDMIVWPEEKITWTNAVLLLAADALYHLTPASRIFYHKAWNTSALDSEPIFNQTGEI